MKATGAELAKAFQATLPLEELDTTRDLYPKSLAYVVVQQEGARALATMRWGFPPPMAARSPVTNVRNLTSPFWRSALSRPDRRCLVPVTSFCEWEGAKGSKVKRWFAVPSQPIFAFAGVWRPTETEPAFAFLTCEPNPLVAPIHAKAMPVILHPEQYDQWLTLETATACDLAQPFPSQLMTVE